MPLSEADNEADSRFNIEMPQSFFDLVPSDFFQSNSIAFAVHVTGGEGEGARNNCIHSGVNFQAKINYVESE